MLNVNDAGSAEAESRSEASIEAKAEATFLGFQAVFFEARHRGLTSLAPAYYYSGPCELVQSSGYM